MLRPRKNFKPEKKKRKTGRQSSSFQKCRRM